jgi:copper chaperone NosL
MDSGGKTRLKAVERVGLVISALLIVIGDYFPLWGMTLVAPQYPEGLRVKIFANQITGNLDIINTLNHYVGMRDLDGMSFPELKYMTWVLVILAVFFLLSALIGRFWSIITTMGISIVIGLVGVYDLYSKLYDYGHNLDPHAPIKLSSGFTPPVLGENQLANFHTFSYFLTGSYLIILSGLIGVWVLWRFLKRRRYSV